MISGFIDNLGTKLGDPYLAQKNMHDMEAP